MGGRKPIYVESRIRAPMDALWNATQDPSLHQRWDVRFGEITYLPIERGEPQRFTYATTIAPGVTIAGTGESLGDKDRADGSRWSGLKFWANDFRSIIKAGGGYWRYIPTEDGIRFLTRYDYRPRWGRFGEFLDRVAFRPLFGWATAWSFDRLRIWLEDGVPPERSRNDALVHTVAVAGLAGIWIYQGLVPKVWNADETEVDVWTRLGAPSLLARLVVRAVGIAEVAYGVKTARSARHAWPFIVSLGAMPIATVGAAKADRSLFRKAFNPASLNLAVAALSAIALLTRRGAPSGKRPLRVAPDLQPEVENMP